MSGCDPKSYHNITPEVFESLKNKLAQLGYPLEGAEGQVNGPFGIVLEYKWDEPDAALYVKVKDKSFFVPCSQIDTALSKAIQEAGGK